MTNARKKKATTRKRKHTGGKPEHVPTEITRAKVEAMSACGTPQTSIAAIIGIDDKTLRKHYRFELDFALDKANAAIGGKLYQKAISGDRKAQEFWLKTRARWSTNENVNLNATVANMDINGGEKVERANIKTPSEAAAYYKEFIKRCGKKD